MSDLYRVYKYTSPERKSYIGYTGLCMSDRSCGDNGWGYLQMEGSPFAEAIKKFGWPAMEQSILRLCTSKEEAQFYERYYILMEDTLFPNGYNLNFGTRNIREKKEEVFRAKKKRGVERGIPKDDETKQKIAETMMKNPPKGQEIIQKDLNGNVVGSFCSINEAARAVDGNREKIRECIRGKRKHYKNSSWESIGDWSSGNMEVLQYVNKFSTEPIARFSSLREAERETGVNRKCILKCIEGEIERAGNYIWRQG